MDSGRRPVSDAARQQSSPWALNHLDGRPGGQWRRAASRRLRDLPGRAEDVVLQQGRRERPTAVDWSLLDLQSGFGRHAQGPVLKDLGVADADPHRLRGLLDGACLEEAKLEYAPVAVG